MQSDTFLNDTDSEDDDTSSESSGDLPKNNNIGTLYEFPKEAVQGERFIDQSSQEKYLNIRNELFTRDIETIRLCFHTNYTVGASNTYKYEIDLVEQYKLGSVDNIIGFELIGAEVMNNGAELPFIDLVIPEIPHKACRINEYGQNIIARLKTYASSEITHYYGSEPQKTYRNYFSPIQLSKLTLEIYNPDGTQITSTTYKIFYEFEVTILKRPLSER